MELIVTLLENPTVIAAIVALLTGFLPAASITALYGRILAFVEKTPLLGALVKILHAYFNKAMASAEAGKVSAASQAANTLVVGAEQLKTLGTIDGPTAAAQITAKLVKDFSLDTDTARKVTEAAVRDMHRFD